MVKPFVKHVDKNCANTLKSNKFLQIIITKIGEKGKNLGKKLKKVEKNSHFLFTFTKFCVIMGKE